MCLKDKHIRAVARVVCLVRVRVELAVFQLIQHVVRAVHACALSVSDRSHCVQ